MIDLGDRWRRGYFNYELLESNDVISTEAKRSGEIYTAKQLSAQKPATLFNVAGSLITHYAFRITHF